jgi:hypothetical protein
VYIYGIDVVRNANISFSMNNPPISSFHYYEGTATYAYHSLFFSATGLDPQAQHTVAWVPEQSSAGGISALFDYAIITIDQTDASSGAPPGGGPSPTGGTPPTGANQSPTGANQSCVQWTCYSFPLHPADIPRSPEAPGQRLLP